MDKQARYLFSQEIAPLIIPKEKVVTVSPEWNLERALLVLTRRGYNSVPVIDEKNRVEGLISKTHILDIMMQKNVTDFYALSGYTVREAMDQNHSGILPNSIFSFAFEVLTDRSYIPIINTRNEFMGILTRRVMMKKVTEFLQQEFFASEWVADRES